ncbi:helix-turn-helix domain-containing protein [Burkholderia cepacia]|uniref:helix-turn-helix domain-containing protein n=1 Tax=Burkholderia cepacia TaxID=292 RepID=UPI000AF6CEA7|nr:helix-turn-helix domain-containing protein [Burkholderia cepacia]
MAQDNLESSKLAGEVGAAIAARRKAIRLTQAEVAAALSVEKETISRMETGVITPTLFRLKQLSSVLKCPMGDLLDNPELGGADHSKTVARLLDELPEHSRDAVVRIVGEVVAAMLDVKPAKRSKRRQASAST